MKNMKYNRPNIACYTPGGGVLYIFWVRGRAIGKGIDFHDFGIRNGIDFHEIWYKERYHFSRFSQLVLDPVSIFGKLV